MNHSPEIGQLATALAAAQAEFPTVKKDASNPFYKSKYADLASIIETVQPVLGKYGIAVIQCPQTDIEKKLIIVTTMLMHKSGEWISNEFVMPIAEWKAQGLGSSTTYACRYSLAPMLRVAAAEDDDDGNKASGLKGEKPEVNEFAPKPKVATKSPVTPQPKLLDAKQRQMFWADCKKISDNEEMIRAAIEHTTGKTTTKDLFVHETGRILEALRDLVREASGEPNPFDQEVAP